MCQRPGERWRWDTVTYGNHIKTTTRKWDRSLARAESAYKRAKAQYNPRLTREQVCELEMGCARREIGVEIESGPVSKFYYLVDMRALNVDGYVGVSRGEFTNYIFVIAQACGSVHGYPVTEKELRESKGVELP